MRFNHRIHRTILICLAAIVQLAQAGGLQADGKQAGASRTEAMKSMQLLDTRAEALHGQSGYSKGPATDIGFVMGYNHSSHVGDDTDLEGMDVHPGSISGFEGGISLRWPVSDRFFVLSELLYVHGGSDEKITAHVGDWDIDFLCDYRVSYLSMPVHIGGRLFSVKEWDVELFAGPYMAFPVSGKYDFHNGLTDSLETSDITSYVSTDLGFSIGEGIYRDTKLGRIGLDLRYFWGFVYSGYPTYEGQEEAPLKNLFLTVNLRWYPAF